MCHKETPCVAILNKQKCQVFSSFFLLQNRRAQQALPGEVVPVGGGRRWRNGKGG
jgi:hypothetical protein